LKKRWSSRTAY